MKIIAVAAISLDGFITRGKEPGTAFTSQADKDWFMKMMPEFPVKIMGRKTFEASKDYILEQARASDRYHRLVLTRSPEDFEAFHIPGRLEFTNRSAKEVVASLSDAYAQNTQVAVLGGGSIYSTFLNAGLLDEFWITLEPQLFGSGTPVVTEAATPELILTQTIQLGPSTLLLKYQC